MKRKGRIHISYFIKNAFTIVGLVLIWRGIWYVLDALDIWFFGGSHGWTALGGVALGLIILYWPDKDLKEIEKL